jgi:glutathione S-transferase
MSFTLYDYVLSGNCYKIRLLAALLGVKYDSVAVDFHPGNEHRSEPMLALNPAGTLPVIVADDMVLTETPAMLAWLAARFDDSGKWWPRSDPRAAAEIQQWLAFSSELSATAAHRALRRIELHLSERVFDQGIWLVGDHPTIADIACFPYIALSPDAGIEHDAYPAIRGWLYAMRGLPGFITMPGIHAMHDQRGEEDANV